MNVWIVNHYAIPPSLGGLVRHYYFSKYLRQDGHKVKIFTSSKIHNTDVNMIRDGALYKEVVMDDVEYTFVRSRNYRGNGLDRIFNMIDFPFKMWKVMRIFCVFEKPDVIYVSTPDVFTAFFAILFAKKRKVPIITEVRDLWPQSLVEYNKMSSRNPIIQILYQLEKWIYRKSDRLIFTMSEGKEYIRDRGWDKHIDLKKIGYINNGVDIEEFEQNCLKYRVSDDDLERTDVFKVIYMGSVRKANNLGFLIEAAEYLKERTDILILIYGDGTEKKQLEDKCRMHGLRVKFKGRVEKKFVPYILSKSNLNLINIKETRLNKYGCSWNKLFEYMASGRPILCNLPVADDLIEEYNLGVTQRFSSARDYANSILDFCKLPQEQYEAFCANAKRCAEEFDYKKLSKKVEKILSDVYET